jgi:hypothetical protein
VILEDAGGDLEWKTRQSTIKRLWLISLV